MTPQEEQTRRIDSLVRNLQRYDAGELPPDVMLALAADLEIMQRRVWNGAIAARAAVPVPAAA